MNSRQFHRQHGPVVIHTQREATWPWVLACVALLLLLLGYGFRADEASDTRVLARAMAKGAVLEAYARGERDGRMQCEAPR